MGYNAVADITGLSSFI